MPEQASSPQLLQSPTDFEENAPNRACLWSKVREMQKVDPSPWGTPEPPGRPNGGAFGIEWVFNESEFICLVPREKGLPRSREFVWWRSLFVELLTSTFYSVHFVAFEALSVDLFQIWGGGWGA